MNEPILIKLKGKRLWGYEKCPTWLKIKYRRAVNHICQDCKKHEDEVGTLEPHRIKRGVENGLYMVVSINHILSNCKVLCRNCHEKYNYSKKVNYQYSI